MRKISVLVVDDSAVMRRMACAWLNAEHDIIVAGFAADAYEAREKIKALNPDVITLDIEMPGMNGLTFLEKVMTLRPMPVVMLSSLSRPGAEMTLRAFEMGAFEAVGKPESLHDGNAAERTRVELTEKVRAAASANIRRLGANQTPPPAARLPGQGGTVPRLSRNRVELIAVCASTGGVETLKMLTARLPENAPPVVIVQHMHKHFTAAFAETLNRVSPLQVTEAKDRTTLLSGHAYVAPGGKHLRIVRKGASLVALTEEGPAVSGHIPSGDVLFRSAAETAGALTVGVILTGMGKDGAAGLKILRDKGALTLGQSRDSCVVYGMPHAAALLGASIAEGCPVEISRRIIHHCETFGGNA